MSRYYTDTEFVAQKLARAHRYGVERAKARMIALGWQVDRAEREWVATMLGHVGVPATISLSGSITIGDETAEALLARLTA